MKWRAAILAVVFASSAAANAPHISLRPVSREDVFPVALPNFAPRTSIRPVLRPASLVAVRRTRPYARAKGFPKPTKAKAIVGSAPSKSNAKIGNICRDRKLRGSVVGTVPAKLAGCGIPKGAIKLYSVSGVRLSTPAVMECSTAKALKSWVENGMSPAVGRYGGGVVELKVAAGYACRTRNSKKGAKISEHGKGRAIDISAFDLKNGDRISVLKDWGNGTEGRILRSMHKSACGPFGTVLGPNANRQHKDHFHFDVARYRNGSYCR